MANGRVGKHAWIRSERYSSDLVYIGGWCPDVEVPEVEPTTPDEELAFLEAAAKRLAATGPTSHDPKRASIALELTSKVGWDEIDLSGHRGAATYFGHLSNRIDDMDLSDEAIGWLENFGIHRA